MRRIWLAGVVTCAAGTFCGAWMTMTAHSQNSSADRCVSGFVWREAFSGDRVCVTPATRDQAAADNRLAPSRRQPGGGSYGSSTCRPGFVWREARPSDRVCVTPAVRAQAQSDNARHASRIDRTPRTCTLYQHRDYGGSRYVLQNGDYLIMINEPDIGTSDGIFRRRYDSSWNDQVSSFRLSGGCSLTLWQHIDRGGARFEANTSHSYVGSSWNDQASEALCACGGLPNF